MPAEELPAVLGAVRRRADRAAVFLDYDGTLAPIVDDPAAARPLAGVPAVLDHLARRYHLVAVVSGRPVAFLLEVLGHPAGVHLAGLYGMEAAGPRPGAGPGAEVEIEVDPEVAPWRPVVGEVTAAAARALPSGAEVEAKGLTVTLHWRARPEVADAVRALARREMARTGLVAQPGRMALELRPPVAADKGTVVRRLAAGLAAAACFGDDLGDLPAFAALADLERAGLAVARVAVADADSPPEVAAAADLVVEGPAAALRLLEQMAAG